MLVAALAAVLGFVLASVLGDMLVVLVACLLCALLLLNSRGLSQTNQRIKIMNHSSKKN